MSMPSPRNITASDNLTQVRAHGNRLVAFRPCIPNKGNDKIFTDSSYVHVSETDHWMDPMRYLAYLADTKGIELHTEDLVDLAKADALILQELPMTRYEIERLRELYPRLKLILQILETPIGRSWAFDPENHKCFDAVVTYDKVPAGSRKYFNYNIPVGGFSKWQELRPGIAWENRRVASMVAHARLGSPKIPRKSGLGVIKAGWKFTFETWLGYIYNSGSLFSERISVASALAYLLPGDFHIFGPSWDIFSNKAISQAWQGSFTGSKLDLLGRYKFHLAYENCLNDNGYISEKLFDALLAGTVPVYLGNASITDQVPSACFIDSRLFSSPKKLGLFLKEMSKHQWEEMRRAGDEFLLTQAEGRFGSVQYAYAVIDALNFACKSEDQGISPQSP